MPDPTRGHPATHCSRVYSDAEREWLLAVERFQRDYHCRYPTCRDLLQLALGLGYRRVAPPREPRPPTGR